MGSSEADLLQIGSKFLNLGGNHRVISGIFLFEGKSILKKDLLS